MPTIGHIPDTRTPEEKRESHERALETLRQLKEQSRLMDEGIHPLQSSIDSGSMIVLRRV